MNTKIEQEILKRLKKIWIIDNKIQKLRKEKKYHSNYVNQQYFRQRKNKDNLTKNVIKLDLQE